MNWNLTLVAEVTGGRLVGPDATITGFSTDSRITPAGALFVALRGEHFDGHQFVDAARAAGAAAVLVEAAAGVTSEPRVEVVDARAALLDLAVAHRATLAVPVIAVTGSAGKTSTKDLAAAALGPAAWASPQSFNNEIGVPLTILATPPSAAAVVVEVGSRSRGDIRHLLPAVRPDVAIITNIGLAHYATFAGSVVDAKWELAEGLEGGTAVVPFDDTRLHRPGPARVTFGTDPGADVAALDVRLDSGGRPAFRLRAGDEEVEVKLRVAGEHQALNAAAAAAAALAVGRSLPEVAAGLEATTGSAWRMEVHRGRFTVVNDAYNSNPEAAESALRSAAAMGSPLVAVLGKMEELGGVEAEAHRRVGSLAARLGFDVIVVGEDPGLATGAGDRAHRVGSVEEARGLASKLAGDGGVVLVKASRAVGLERLALALAEEATS